MGHSMSQSFALAAMRGASTSFQAGPSSVAFNGEAFAISKSDLQTGMEANSIYGQLMTNEFASLYGCRVHQTSTDLRDPLNITACLKWLGTKTGTAHVDSGHELPNEWELTYRMLYAMDSDQMCRKQFTG